MTRDQARQKLLQQVSSKLKISSQGRCRLVQMSPILFLSIYFTAILQKKHFKKFCLTLYLELISRLHQGKTTYINQVVFIAQTCVSRHFTSNSVLL